ncbi:hypothetical protein NHX12_022258 [Muraenolepis orangiensis]|uniref:Uncharacterized protein n=1 Tax=Muraenolepis orangiensis TaxID=630683 RepID=A0A9Q0ITC0_9TELE|nr:hypothetical protein NHX12_022258 [Muraenolepis orangiensis]
MATERSPAVTGRQDGKEDGFYGRGEHLTSAALQLREVKTLVGPLEVLGGNRGPELGPTRTVLSVQPHVYPQCRCFSRPETGTNIPN